MVRHILYERKWKFSSRTCNSYRKWNNETCQRECKNYCTCKKDCSLNRSTYICENGEYMTNITDYSKILYNEI